VCWGFGGDLRRHAEQLEVTSSQCIPRRRVRLAHWIHPRRAVTCVTPLSGPPAIMTDTVESLFCQFPHSRCQQENLMHRPIVSTVVFVALATLGSVTSGQESTKADFAQYGRAMDGHWLGNITLWADVPGIGKAGDKKEVRWVQTFTADGNAIVGRGSDGKGTCNSLYFYDVEKRQVRGIAVFSGGTVVSSVVSRRDNDTWVRRNTAVDPDGTKSETSDTLSISDGGDTHTWTRGDASHVWRRTRK
jgi:hypothetical protein